MFTRLFTATSLCLTVTSAAAAQTCEFKLTAPDGDGYEELGFDVELSASFALTGAPGERLSSQESNVGAVYHWYQSQVSNEWFYRGKLQAPTPTTGERFGESLDRDQWTIVVGAPGRSGPTASTPGAAYVFRTADGGLSFSHEATLTASDGDVGDLFGASVAISDDWIVVGAPGADFAGNNRGAAYTFERVGTNWVESERIDPPSDISGLGFGSVVSADGRLAVCGGRLLSGGVSSGGSLAAYRRNSSELYTYLELVEPSTLGPGDFYASCVDLEDGLLAVGATNDDDAALNAGAAYVFRYDVPGRTFDPEAKLVPNGLQTNDSFGSSISVENDRVAVGAEDRSGGGAAWMFRRILTAWTTARMVRPAGTLSYGRVGTSVCLSGGDLLIGDIVDDTEAFSSGAAYVLNATGADLDMNGVTDACESLYDAYCTNAAPNSSGAAATMSAVGSPFIDDQNLKLRADDLPFHAYGYFLASKTEGSIPNPGGSQGDLCLGGTIGRFIAQVKSSGAEGAVEIVIDLDALPSPLPAAALAGESWNFQLWYRDANPGVTSNFSSALTVDFQ